MENILVIIRVRPLSKQEASKGSAWKLSPKTISLSNTLPSSGQIYNFDRVFDHNSRTRDIYDSHTQQIISSAVQGFNGTIFAYGQTSSGKSFTMRGSPEEPGIIPLAIQDVFRSIKETQNREFLVRVSYMEIYNEEIKDLLAPENCRLQIHENFERGIFVPGLREEIAGSPELVLELMDHGEAHRHVGETNMNVHSSRSHAIFRMVIESRDRSQDVPSDGQILTNTDPVRVSHLNLVDLAGSERVSKSGAEGTRLKEGTHINKSLMTLGNVINKLSEGTENKGGHVPYRDSKLTRILQPALGGNARTVIICNVTPALVHVDETRGTLLFASRANRVTNCAQVNEVMTDAALLKRQKKEIAELRRKLENQESPSDQFDGEILNLRNELLKTELERERMALELQQFQKAQAQRERQIKEQEQKIENLSTMVINSAFDNREFDKRGKRGNRRETWCARPQSGLPVGLLEQKKPFQGDVPKSASAGLPFQINRERSFGLPPPFESLTEEEEGFNLTSGTSFSFDEDNEEGFGTEEGFSIQEFGSESFVADRRRRVSNEWITANEIEQQLADVQGQYDTLQCEYIVKLSDFGGLAEGNLFPRQEFQMKDKDSEIEQLRNDVVSLQSMVNNRGRKDMKNKKFLDADKRGKSLDGWTDSESAGTIKKLRAQVVNLETEKLYIERELERVLEQAKQSYSTRQELEEVYEELNSAKEHSAELTSQLSKSQMELQQFQKQKREDEVAYLQLVSALTDLKTEVDRIKVPSSDLQSSFKESLQLITFHVNAFQECIGEATSLSSLAKNVCEKNETALNSGNTEAGPEHHQTGSQTLRFDDVEDRRESYPRTPTNLNAEAMRPDGKCGIVQEDYAVKPQLSSEEAGPHRLDAADQRQVDSPSGSIDSQSLEEHDEGSLKDDQDILHSTVEHLQKQIQLISSERQSLLDQNRNLEEEIARKRALVGVMDDSHCQESEGPNLAYSQVLAKENWQIVENEMYKQTERSAMDASASPQNEEEQAAVENPSIIVEGESDIEDKHEDLKLSLPSIQEENRNQIKICDEGMDELKKAIALIEILSMKLEAARSLNPERVISKETEIVQESLARPEANDKLSMLGGEVDWAIEELKTLYETIGFLRIELRSSNSEASGFLLRESAFAEEVVHLRSSLQFLKDEKDALGRQFEEIQSELERWRLEMNAIHRKIGSAENKETEVEQEHWSNVVPEIDRRIQEWKVFKDMVGVLKGDVEKARKEVDLVLLREVSLVEENVSLRSSLQAVADDQNAWITASDVRLAELERQKVELDNTLATLQVTTENNVHAQKHIMDLNTLLSQKQKELESTQKRLLELEQEKSTHASNVAQSQSELESFREGALKDMEGWQHQYQIEAAQYKADIMSLKKELSSAKAIPAGLSKERDGLQRDLEKTRSKMKDVEAKLKAALQDKCKLESEKLNLGRDLKQLRQSKSLQLDINRRDSIVDQRRQSIALGVEKTKNQLSSVEHALQMRTDEVGSLTNDLRLSQEAYASLEFAMAEAEGYSKERLTEMEGVLNSLKDENHALTSRAEQLQNEVRVAKEHCRSELGILQEELVAMKGKLHESEENNTASQASVAAVAKEKDEVVEELLDAHINFQKQKTDLMTQVQENREKCNALNLDIISLTEELQKFRKLLEESSDVNRVLEDRLQQALEVNSKNSLSHHNLLKQLEADVESQKDRCRELETAQRQEEALRYSGLAQLEKLRVELQQYRTKLCKAEDAERLLSVDNKSFLIANTKLQFSLDASSARLEVFEGRLDESDWELNEFKSMLHRNGFVRGDGLILGSLQQFEKHVKARNHEAKGLETQLATKKMEIIDLKVQIESIKTEIQRYEEEVQHLQSKVLTPQQENEVRKVIQQNEELLSQNQELQCQFQTGEDRTMELCELLKVKDVSLTEHQGSIASLRMQNNKLENDLAAIKFELQCAQQLQRIGIQAASTAKPVTPSVSVTGKAATPLGIATGKATTPSFTIRPQPQRQAPLQSASSLPVTSEHIESPDFREGSQPSATAHHPLEGGRMPLGDMAPCTSVRKRARLFPEKSAVLPSRRLGPRLFTLPESHARLDQDKENVHPE